MHAALRLRTPTEARARPTLNASDLEEKGIIVPNAKGREGEMIVQIVRASIKREERGRWLEVIKRNAAQTRAEEGCQGYQVAEDLEAPNTFVIVELWTNLDAVKNHFRAQFEELMSALGDVFAEPPEAFIHEVASTMTLQEVLAAAGMAR